MQVVVPIEEPERATEDSEVLTNPLHGSGNANIESSIEMASIARKDRDAVHGAGASKHQWSTATPQRRSSLVARPTLSLGLASTATGRRESADDLAIAVGRRNKEAGSTGL